MQFCPNCDCIAILEYQQEIECATAYPDVWIGLERDYWCPCCDEIFTTSDCPDEPPEECPPAEFIPDDVMNYGRIEERQAANVSAGTFTNGAWRVRVLNTEAVFNAGVGIGLVIQQAPPPPPIVLTGEIDILEQKGQAGIYLVRWQAPAFAVARHQTRLRIGIGTFSYVYGTSEAAAAGTMTISSGAAVVEVEQSIIHGGNYVQRIQLEHRCQNTVTGNGFGVASNFAADYELYSIIDIYRLRDA